MVAARQPHRLTLLTMFQSPMFLVSGIGGGITRRFAGPAWSGETPLQRIAADVHHAVSFIDIGLDHEAVGHIRIMPPN